MVLQMSQFGLCTACLFPLASLFAVTVKTQSVQAHFMVQVRSAIPSSTDTRLCGGALLSTTHVVTAAACLVDDASAVKVYSGTTELWASGANGTEHGVLALRKHPSFSSKNVGSAGIVYNFDVAVLRLDTPVALGRLASTIGVPASGKRVPAGTSLSLAGWGIYFFGNMPEDDSKNRLEVDSVAATTSKQCSAKFLTPISQDQFCLTKTPDMGNSGSAVFAGRQLYGLVSWGGSVCTDLTNTAINSFIATSVKQL